ncbi:S-adenosyl-L-methionine-dependent methyltransferase [Podospora didyma]|uniref:Arsenite methyltransferase n=1 Tax=Podospora didyma TaxID=330526 RepID=A0AAE0P828_9PEZI|nr:S-adenosyl-L-methionine-dependent methyltransferase [Podospora didyma]
MDATTIYEKVREHYSAASGNTSAKYGEAVAKSFGYTEEELANIPDGANLGLSCGNPLAIATLREGETVVDLGSGAGFDIFLAAPKVGPSGRAIGVDMNDDMLARANKIKASKKDAENITFIKGVITAIPLESSIADCIISNCVINLVPESEKALVFKEMHRILKPGGRVAVSDILAKQPLPDQLRNDITMYVGCIAGASQLLEYEKYLNDAGFGEIIIADTHADLNVYLDTNEDGTNKSDCCAPAASTATSCGDSSNPAASCCGPVSSTAAKTPKTVDLNEWVGSYKIYAVKN